MAKTKTYIIGIDEVGRGPLAGPVTVAAVLLTADLKTYKLKNFPDANGSESRSRRFSRLPDKFSSGLKRRGKTPLRDSKKLNPKQREAWFAFIKQQKIPYATANIFPKTIDKINVSKAANLAATRALNKLLTINKKQLTINYKINLDGGLKILPKFSDILVTNGYIIKTIIKGDEKIPAIALASIVAKVRRDKYMEKMHKKFPQYDFKKHKGYGTKIHYKLLKKNGASEIHRKSFLS